MATSQLHEDYSREEQVKAGTDRGFGLVFAGFFAILAALSLWHGSKNWHYTLPVAAAFLVVALTYPRALAPLNRLWLKFGLLLYKVMNPLVLGLLFFVTIMRPHISHRFPMERAADAFRVLIDRKVVGKAVIEIG